MIDLNIFLKTVNFFSENNYKKVVYSRIIFLFKFPRPGYLANKYHFEICNMISPNKITNYSDTIADPG